MRTSNARAWLLLWAGALLSQACGAASVLDADRAAEVEPSHGSERAEPALWEEPAVYAAGSRELEGILVRPGEAGHENRPGVIIAHDFLGVGEYPRQVARRLATAGYVVLVADFYGRGRRPANVEEANRFAMEVRADPVGTREALTAAYQYLMRAPGVAPEQIAIIGYSVGGVAALELARAGAELTAVIGLWPILDSTRAADATPIRAEVLVLVGALDPLTPEASVDAFRAALERENTPPRIEVLPGVAHAFTVPAVGTDVSTGFAYDADAEAHAWRAVDALLQRVAPAAH